MSLPSVNINFQDGNVGITAGGAGRNQAKVGVSAGGTPGVVYGLGNASAAKQLLVAGPLLEAAVQFLSVAQAPCFVCPTAQDTAGAISSPLVLTGSGPASTVTATLAPLSEIKVKVQTAGAVGTAAFQFSVGGGAYSARVVSAGTTWAYRVPGTFTTLTFAPGSYRLDDVYTIPVSGVVSASSPSGGPDTITQASSPADAYQVAVVIRKGGAVGTSTFSYALDYAVDAAGNASGNLSAPITTAATYAIPGSGIVIDFGTGTYVVGDVYQMAYCAPASSSTGSVQTAINALLANPNPWECVHVVGTSASSATAASALEPAIDSVVQAAATNHQYVFGVMEIPTVGSVSASGVNTADTDATVESSFSSVASAYGRVVGCAGDVRLQSPVSGLNLRRNLAWALTARMGASKRSELPGKVLLGPIPNVSALYRDESATPGLDDVRLNTMRTLQGKAGYYLTFGHTMAPQGSDFGTIPAVRVANAAATIAFAAYTEYLNDDVRVNPSTGYIDERDAQSIDRKVSGMLQSQLTGASGSANDECSAIYASLSRTDNILSSQTVNATISIVGKAYFRNINVQLGFANPLV